MKSGVKRHSAFAFEEMSMPMSSHWIVMNKRSRVPTIEEFCSDKDSKCTASTVDSSVSYDDFSSSSSTKRCRTCDDSHCDNNCSCSQMHSQGDSRSQIHGRDNARGSGSLTSDDEEEEEDIHKARTLNCTELQKKLVPLRSICDSGSNSDKHSKTNQQHSENNDWNTTSGRKNEGGAESIRKNTAKNGILDPWTTNDTSNSSNYSSSSSNSNYSSSNIICNEADGKVKMIGLPGIRSRWAWIHVETKTEPSPNLCSKGNSNGKGETNSSNTTTTTDNINNTTTKKRRRSTPTAAIANATANHAEHQMMSDNGSMKNSLKALRDYCGKGSYWTEPTQRRRQVTPNRYSYKKKKVGRKRQRTACGSKSKSNNSNSKVLRDPNMNDDRSSSSISRSDTNTTQTSSKNNTKKVELHSATHTCNREKEDAAPSSSLMTRTRIARSRNTTIRASNADHTIRKNNDVTKIIRTEDTEPPRDSTEIVTKAFVGETGTSCSSTSTTKPKVAATSLSASTHNYDDCNHQKIIFRAMEGPNQPIVRYALDLISLVCNNSYSTTHSNNGSVKSCTLQHNGSKRHRCCWSYQQVHRVLDKPPFGSTTETESEKERLMRLQFRQRFASATSTGMSPIEFAKKLLSLWGGRLEEVVGVSTKENISHVVDNTVGNRSSKQTERVHGDSNQEDETFITT